jgi:hypothetical protein
VGTAQVHASKRVHPKLHPVLIISITYVGLLYSALSPRSSQLDPRWEEKGVSSEELGDFSSRRGVSRVSVFGPLAKQTSLSYRAMSAKGSSQISVLGPSVPMRENLGKRGQICGLLRGSNARLWL